MPALNRLIVTIALALIASAVLAQPPDTPRVDTVHTYDTVVVKHTTYVLDSSSDIQKEVAELKGEFYEKAVDALSRENSDLGTVFTMISFLLIIIGIIGAYSGYTAHKARQAVDREVDQMRALRNEMARLYESAESDASKMRRRLEEAGESSKSSVAPSQEEEAAGEERPFQDRIKLITEADAQKSIDLYEQLRFDMTVGGISESTIPSSLRRNVGLNYMRLGRWEKAVKELEVYLKDSPTDTDVLFAVAFALGEMYNATEDTDWLERALEKYQKVTEIKPDMHYAFYNWGNDLGKMYNATNDSNWLERAFEKYKKATEIKPDHHSAFNNWGIGLISMYQATKERKWLEEAIEKSRRALEIAPDRKDRFYSLACAQALLGENDEMISSLREAIDYDDKDKKMAREDEDFKAYWDKPDFIALTKEDDEGEDTG